MGTAGPQLKVLSAWAPLDLNQGPSEPSGHRWTTTWDLPSSVGTAGPQRPDGMTEYMPEYMPERLPEYMPARLPEYMPHRMPHRMPDYMPDRTPKYIQDKMLEDTPDR